jgi:hypothetical protein
MDDFNNPWYRLGAAMGKLTFFYTRWECLVGYAFTSTDSDEKNYWMRKALKAKAQGIVLHDQLLNGKGLQ